MTDTSSDSTLSSKLLWGAAQSAKCDFCITGFVQYECLIKPRKTSLPADVELMNRLRNAQSIGKFRHYSCSIEDLHAIKVLEDRQRLGKGELSTIAFAIRIRQAVITDDLKARKLSVASGCDPTQTTPHLFSWLIFTGKLADSDKGVVISQHQEMGRPLGPHLERAYDLALQCKINTRGV